MASEKSKAPPEPAKEVLSPLPKGGDKKGEKPSELGKAQLDTMRKGLLASQNKLKDQKTKLEEAVKKEEDTKKASQDLLKWSSPGFPKVDATSYVLQKQEFGPLLTSYQIRENLQKEVEKSQKEYMDELKKVHPAEIIYLVEEKKLGDIDKLARENAYGDIIKASITSEKIPGLDKKIADTIKTFENSTSFKKLPEKDKENERTKQEKNFREKLVDVSLDSAAAKIEKFQNLTAEEKSKPENNISELKKNLKESLGLDDSGVDSLMTKLIDEKQVKDQIIKNITEKGIFVRGIDIDSPLGKEINKKQQEALSNIISLMGDNINLEDLPLDIKQRLLLEDASNSNNPEKLIDAGNIPDVLDKQIGRTRKEIFRQKSGETDQEYTQRVDDRLKKNTGLSMKEVSKVTGKLSPFVKFLADLLAPLGALMGGEVGEFWRNYMKQSGTADQQNRWANNSKKYYGKEGETAMSKNRESHKKNLADYAGCNNPDLMPTVGKMRANQSKYEAVSQKLSEKTGGKKKIGWEVIAAIHYREGDMDFATYLHNGDKLGSPTVHVPAGIHFPNSTEGWVDAAVDALNRESYLENMSTDSSDGLANIAEYAEKYNGPAYRNQGKNSPYVWAGSGGINVAGLIKVDHGPITNQQDKRLGIMPIVLELAGYTSGGKMTDEQKKKLKSDEKEITETAGKDPVQWFKNNADKPYGSTGEGKYDCMTSTNTALGLPYEHHVKTFGSQHILGKDKNGVEKPQDLWGVSMAAAIYAGKINGPTSESSKNHPIELEGGWYGGAEKANNPANMEYYIEENVMKRVDDGASINDVGGNGSLVHYSKKNGIQNIIDDIGNRLTTEGQSAMMGATGEGTNLGGHEWLVSREGGKLMVYEATNAKKNGKEIGVSGTGVELSQYLSDNRRAQYGNEAIILAPSPANNQIKQAQSNSPKTANKPLRNNSDKITDNQPQGGTIYIGDSITTAAFYNEDDSKAKKQDKYGEYYEIGAGSGKILKFVEKAVNVMPKPPSISILAGTNDVSGGDDPLPNIRKMIGLCREKNIPVFLGTLPPIPSKQIEVNKYNEQIRALAGNGVKIIDYARLPLVTSGLHPGPSGYAMMRKLAHNTIVVS